MDTHILFWRVFNVVLVQTLGQIDSVILKIKGLVNQMDEGLGGQRRQALFIAFGMYLMISVELFFKIALHQPQAATLHLSLGGDTVFRLLTPP